MATGSDTDRSFLRTVTPPSDKHDNSQMNAVGWIIFGLLAIVLLPLLPVIALIWLFDRLVNR